MVERFQYFFSLMYILILAWLFIHYRYTVLFIIVVKWIVNKNEQT